MNDDEETGKSKPGSSGKSPTRFVERPAARPHPENDESKSYRGGSPDMSLEDEMQSEAGGSSAMEPQKKPKVDTEPREGGKSKEGEPTPEPDQD
jgi:hypothetical protein